jgi:hypothetical protein
VIRFFSISLILSFHINLAAQSAYSILAPSARLSEFTATSYLPNSYLGVGSVSPSASLNFSVGDFFESSGNAISNLVDSRAYLGAYVNVNNEIFSYIRKGRKKGWSALGLNLSMNSSFQLDRDFLRLATSGILPEGFGSEKVESKGIEVQAHLFSELYFHKVRRIGKLSYGYRLRLVNPIAGAQFLTERFNVERINNVNENSFEVDYSFLTSTYGFDPANIALPTFGLNSVFGPNSSFMFDFGFEQELSSKLHFGLAVKNVPGSLNVKDVNQTRISGELDYSGINYTIGVDSITNVFNDLVSFELDSLLPTVEDVTDASLKMPINPKIQCNITRYLSEESVLFITATLRPSSFESEFRTSAFIYSRPNKLFHISYGLNWWTNNNSVDFTVAGRMLVGPYTRVSLGMSNPFALPRIAPNGAVLVPENSQGFNVSVGVSFGIYKGEEF